MAHPHNSEWFSANRNSIHTFVADGLRGVIDCGKRNILVKAPVKSGKREHVECIAVTFRNAAVFYATSLDRKDVARQKAELALYGVATHLINSIQKAQTAVLAIQHELAVGRMVIICFDECDYGSGSEQRMAPLYREFLSDERVVKLYYSASAHETEASKLRDREDYEGLTYVPPAEYCGAEYFLDAGLVAREVDAFFEKDEDDNIVITEHAKLVARESITADRHIGVTRVGRGFSTKNFKNRLVKADIQAQLQAAMGDAREWRIVPVDEKDSHDWEDSDIARRYTNDREVNYLFIIVQTCTRGTDLKGWHHRMAFWHDARSKRKSNLNTLIQAFLRPCHYSSCYGGVPQRIRLYVDYVVVEMAAYDDLTAYLAAGGKPPARTTRGRLTPDGWATPLQVTLPADVLGHKNLAGSLTDDKRHWLCDRLRELLPEEQWAVLEGRQLRTKRIYDGTVTQGGIFTVSQAHAEGRASRPGGGEPGMEEMRIAHFWLDIATEELPDIARGTTYITYGVDIDDGTASTYSMPVDTTRRSMYEA